LFNQPTPPEANTSSASQECPHILCNQTIHYRTHNSVPLVPILSQLNPVKYPVFYLRRSYYGTPCDVVMRTSVAQSLQRLSYGLDIWGSNPDRRQVFRPRPDGRWGPPSLPYNGYRVFFPVLKRSERVLDQPTPTSAEVKERVDLYLYCPSGPSRPVLVRPLP